MQLIGAPGTFFTSSGERLQARQAILFLLISSAVFTGASLSLQQFYKPLLNGAILFSNAFGLAVILSIIGYAVMGASVGKKTTYGIFFSIYAYASGTAMLAAWIPSMVIFSEPWRWVLIGIGLKRGCNLSTGVVIWIIGGSILLVSLLFWSLLPMLYQ